MTPTRRRLAIACSLLLGLAVVFFVGLQLAVRQLQSRLESALGPRASIGAIHTGWTGIELLDVRIKAGPGWPAEDELRATRVRVVPDLRSLAGGPWRIATIHVEHAYLSVLRDRGGRMQLLPALPRDAGGGDRTPGAPPPQAAASPLVEIGTVKVADATLAFFDASVRQPALALRVEQLDATVGPLVLPTLDKAVRVELAGVFKGPQRDGRIAIDGNFTPSTRDAVVHARFAGVDLVALQSYLLKLSEAGIRRGTVDLELDATVQANRLSAPGKLTLTNLELASDSPFATLAGDSPFATLAGVPRKAVLAAMTERGRLEAKFVLDGRLDDPSFSLNENLATKIASGLAEGLGVSLSGVVKGLGGVVKGLFGR